MAVALTYHHQNEPKVLNEQTSILDQLMAGDKVAQRAYYMAELDRLVRIPMRYVKTKNEAITIVNDSFMKIFKAASTLDDPSKLNEWTAAITRNTTLDYIRKRVKYDRRHEDVEHHSNVAITVNAALQSLTMQEILNHVHSLSDKERIVFSMFAIDGYKHTEIASALDITEGTSRWYLSKARTNLQILLKRHMS